MVGEVHIWDTKRKHKLTVQELLTLTECNDVYMYGVPLAMFDKFLLFFRTYDWEIYQNENAEKPMSIDTYLLNEEILTQGLSSIYHIFISTKQVRKPFAYAVLRRGD